MNVLVLNGSPSGKDSITLQTVLYIEKLFPDIHFEILNVSQRIRQYEKDFSACLTAMEKADLILFCYPVYTFLVPSQLHRFIELMKEQKVSIAGKYATQLTTSKHFYDTTAHQFIEDNCTDLGLKYIRGLSADMEDLLSRKGQKEAESFFRYVLWNMETGCFETPAIREAGKELKTSSLPSEGADHQNGNCVIIADYDEHSVRLKAMIDRFICKVPMHTKIVNIREFPFAGGCLGCFNCAADGKCIYKDGFDTFLREQIQTADAMVYAFEVRDHSMGYRFKMFDDRQFCNGHRTVTMGKPVAYLIDGDLSQERNLMNVIEARAEVGGNFLAGTACSENDPDGEIDRTAVRLGYAHMNQYQPPKNFWGVGGLTIFRDLIWQMQGMMKADHEFYKKNGFYDSFPQRHKVKTAAMYLVGAMMRNEKLRKKMGGRMTEGMVMPYKAVIDQAGKKQK